MKYINTFLLFGSLALLIMWVDQVVYKGVGIKDSYFFLMFALAGFLAYTYRKGVQKQKAGDEDKEEKKEKKTKIKASLGNKKTKRKG